MSSDQRIRYAVVGLGSIAQEAVLPAFPHAENSQLAALVSGDDQKRLELGRMYQCPTYTYDQYEACLSSGGVDAVYICLPNHMHREYAEAGPETGTAYPVEAASAIPPRSGTPKAIPPADAPSMETYSRRVILRSASCSPAP